MKTMAGRICRSTKKEKDVLLPELAEGDELYAYDPNKKQYDVYTLGTDGKWTAVKTVEVSVPGTATETTSPAAAKTSWAAARHRHGL